MVVMKVGMVAPSQQKWSIHGILFRLCGPGAASVRRHAVHQEISPCGLRFSWYTPFKVSLNATSSSKPVLQDLDHAGRAGNGKTGCVNADVPDP
jgi:hypothetical protein